MTASVTSRLGRAGAWRKVVTAPGAVLVALLLAGGCEESDSPVALPSLRSCVEVSQALALELDSIQSCTQASQCGQVLEDTSCGCTRNLVARLGASTANFYAIVERGRALGCPVTDFGTVCDCPRADGFACVAGRCTWNYQ